jgi:predicted secreted hydrolase
MKYKERYRPIKFPQDEQKHDHVIEWWYFNGNLKTKDGRSFSYMNTLFSAKPKQVKIPFLRKIPLKTLYFSHSLLSDNKKGEFWHKVSPICLLDPNSFTKPLLWIHYDNACLIEETSKFNYHVVNRFVDLKMSLTKKPLLLNKKGFLDLKVKTTYYYSLTRLETTGLIKLNDKWVEVTGLSWMDHQWAQGPLIRGDKWTWFSIQLENGTDIVCFVYGDEVKTFHASMIDKNNKTKFTDNVIFKTTNNKFTSGATGSEYQLGYEIAIPDWGVNLEVEPFNKKQEMIFGTINYWEGGIKVKGSIANKKVRGDGFMELVGTPMKKNVFNVYLKKFQKELLNQPWQKLSQGINEKLKPYK